MACYLYKLKDGVPVKEEVDPLQVSSLLDLGYRSTEEELITGDLNGDGELTNDEVREMAKDAGIDKWETSRISTLKKALGYED